MKRVCTVFAAILIASASADAMVDQNGEAASPSWGVVPGVVVVQLKPDVEPVQSARKGGAVATGFSVLDQVAADMRATSFARVIEHAQKPPAGSPLGDMTRFYRFEFDVVRDPAQVAAEIAKDPNVELAEVVTWHSVDQFEPNDPDFTSQWHHREGTQVTQDNDIDSDEAWLINTGDPDVVIAIFDTGVLWGHPDLRDQIWVNPGEDLDGDGVVYDVDDFNGIDDDSNGYIDDVIGWDFVAGGSGCDAPGGEDCVVADNNPSDWDGHGTHVAGDAAEASNNGRDGAGVAGGRFPLQQGCRIMPCRAGWATPDGLGGVRTDYVGEGVEYAWRNGALVGNLSAGAGPSSILATALNNAFANGFIFTKSAGNDNNNIPDDFDDYFSTIAVASTTTSDTKSSFSSFGVWVDISAPGSGIWSTYGFHGIPDFVPLSGTSMAAPIVAGCAALIYANNPSFTKAQVENLLFTTADTIDHLNPGFENMLGAGRVNIGAALAAAPQAAFQADTAGVVIPLPDTPLVHTAPVGVQFTDLSPGSPTAWHWDFGTGDTSNAQNPFYTFANPGIYDIRLDATHAGGAGRKRIQKVVVAHADTGFYVNGKNCEGVGKKAIADLHITNALDIHQLVLPLTYQGPANMTLDSFSFAGTRVEYFEDLDKPVSSTSNKFLVFDLTANVGGGSPPLPPGSGPVVRFFLTLGAESIPDTLAPVDTFTVLGFSLKAVTSHGIEYVPDWRMGGVTILSYCRGDFNINGATDASDIIAEVNYIFKSGPTSPDPWTIDVNNDGTENATDVVFLVNYVFKSGPAPE